MPETFLQFSREIIILHLIKSRSEQSIWNQTNCGLTESKGEKKEKKL